MFRVLAIDGGGTRGILPATLLANLERFLNNDGSAAPIGQRFDLIVGTSTGGLIALGLAAGKSARELSEFYSKLCPEIFKKANRRSLIPLFRPWYEQGPLRENLEGIFKDATLHDLETDVCVVGVSLDTWEPRLFKTNYLARNEARLSDSLVSVAMSTAAAPIMYGAVDTRSSKRVIDGGLCANNPAMVALVEALMFERESRRGEDAPSSLEEVSLLSLGTGYSARVPYDSERLAVGGLLKWLLPSMRCGSLPPIYEAAATSQASAIHKQVGLLLEKRYFRFNPSLPRAMGMLEIDGLDTLGGLSDITQDMEAFARSYLN